MGAKKRMKKTTSKNMRLVFSIVTCALFVATVFSGVVIGLDKSVSTPGQQTGDPHTLPWKDDDWDYWTYAPNVFLIPNGNVGIGVSKTKIR